MQVVFVSHVARVEQRSIISEMASACSIGSMGAARIGGLGEWRLGVDCECCTTGT